MEITLLEDQNKIKSLNNELDEWKTRCKELFREKEESMKNLFDAENHIN